MSQGVLTNSRIGMPYPDRTPGEEPRSVWTSANGWTLHTRVYLNEAPEQASDVVLIHGLVVSSTYMVPLMKQLAPDYHVFAPDLPGYGESTKPSSTLSVSQLADALLLWMDSAQVERPMLIANSFGCQIAAEFAIRYPDRARAIVFVGPTVDPHARNLPLQAGRWILNALGEPPSLGFTIIRDIWRAGIRRSINTLRVYIADEIHQKLPDIRVPVLVVRGAQDPIVPERWASQIVELVPDGKLATIPGVGHTANYSAALEIARVSRIFDRHPAHTS